MRHDEPGGRSIVFPSVFLLMRIPESWLTDECISAATGQPPKGVAIPVIRSPWVDRWLARAHWSVPLCVYGPISAVCAFVAWRLGSSPKVVIGELAAGWLFFSLLEYLLHRFVLHRKFEATRAGQIEGFLTHGYHHVYPQDPYRLVMPLMGSVPIALILSTLEVLIFGWRHGLAIFGGTVLGYIAYDTVHYWLHHGGMKNAAFAWLRRYHLLHHHDDRPARFGVSSPLWDYVFFTFAPVGAKARRSRTA